MSPRPACLVALVLALVLPGCNQPVEVLSSPGPAPGEERLPTTHCRADTDCGEEPTVRCYGGLRCQPGCAPGDASCCEGNFCDRRGCSAPAPVGCLMVGCPLDQVCSLAACGPSYCRCDPFTGTWMCDSCGGGVCVPRR